MVVIAIIINILCVYIMVGCVCSMLAAFQSKHDELGDREVLILSQIIFQWAWKYKKLRKFLG